MRGLTDRRGLAIVALQLLNLAAASAAAILLSAFSYPSFPMQGFVTGPPTPTFKFSDNTVYVVGCKGSGDDAGVINTAMSSARTLSTNKMVHVEFNGQACNTKTFVDASGMGSGPVILENGSITCNVTGGVCIWGLGSSNLSLRNFRMFGSATNTPAVGIVRGKFNPAGTVTVSGDMILSSELFGSYTTAVLYDVGTENTACMTSVIQNSSTGASTYAWIVDGINHFNIATPSGATVTQALTQNTGVPGGMHQTGSFDCQIVNRNTSSGTAAMWFAGTMGVDFRDTYIASYGSSGVVDLYQFGASDNNSDFSCQCHLETTSVTEDFLLTGYATPTVQGFYWHDPVPNTGTELIALDSGVTSAAFNHFDLAAWKANGVTNPPVFDTPANYSIYDASVYVPAAAWWPTAPNAFAFFSGCVTLGQAERSCNFVQANNGPISNVMFHTALPFINAPTGTMANNGAITLGTSLATTYANAYIVVPAGAVATGIPAATTAYYATCSTASACTLFNNPYTNGQPTIPASPTAFATTGPGAYTGVTAGTNAIVYQLPANTMGLRDTLRVTAKWTVPANTNTKTLRIGFGGSNALSIAMNTNTQQGYTCSSLIENREVTNSQVTFVAGTTCLGAANATPAYLSADTTTQLNVTGSWTMGTATDFIVLESFTVELLKGQ